MTTALAKDPAHAPLRPGANRVRFESHGVPLVGDLYLPPDFDPAAQLPGVVVTGSWTTVKEQMAGLYARRLADEGYAALAFDFRHYGQSGGEPRRFENPAAKIEDIGAAARWLASLPFVRRVGGLGVCASSGYLAHAAGRDDTLASVALVAPWLHDGELVEAIYGGAEGVAAKIAAGEAARERYEATGEVETVPAVSETDESAAMVGPFDYYLNGERGAIPEWPNSFAVMSWPEWLRFDGVAAAPDVRVPVVMVHSEDAAVPQGARAFYEALPGDKEFVWTEGIQFDFYDREPNVTVAAEAVLEHFRTTL